jgi:hypothetical protein
MSVLKEVAHASVPHGHQDRPFCNRAIARYPCHRMGVLWGPSGTMRSSMRSIPVT